MPFLNTEESKAKKRAYYLKNKERLIAGMKERYHANQAEYYKRVRAWKAKNMEKERAYQRKYLEKNKERERLRVLAWFHKEYAKNPDKYKARALVGAHKYKDRIRARRKARLLSRAIEDRLQNLKRISIQLGQTEGDPEQIVDVITQMKCSKETRCYHCKTPLYGLPIHIDHIIPLSRGGKHSIANLCASCPPCNLSKSDKTIEEWELWKRTVKPLAKEMEAQSGVTN